MAEGGAAPEPVTAAAILKLSLLALIAWPGLVAGQVPAAVPPEPGNDADLATLGAWIERWLPVVGAASYQTVDQTGDFFAHASDSVTGALLEGCTLVLHERFVSTVRGETLERRQAVRVPLDQLDTNVVWPKIRGAQMLLTSPNVLVRGQLVVPLRNRSRTRFITVLPDGEAHQDTLVAEHLVPLLFAELPARRSAFVIRRAAAYCIRSRYLRRFRVLSGGATARGARSRSPR